MMIDRNPPGERVPPGRRLGIRHQRHRKPVARSGQCAGGVKRLVRPGNVQALLLLFDSVHQPETCGAAATESIEQRQMEAIQNVG